jgi:hypothetical protein
MFQAFFRRVQNYADALFAGITKTAQDGRKVIYPRGFLARGYVIASEEDEKRFKQQFAVFLVVAPILIGAGYVSWGLPGSAGIGALILVCYAIYVKRLTANMEPSGDALSVTEAYRAQALKHSPARLWSWIITGIFCVCFGILACVLVPENSASFAFLIVIGVFLAAVGGYFLALRRGANPLAEGISLTGDSVAAEEAASYITGDVGPVRTWFLTIIGLVLTGVGVFMFIVDPAGRSTFTGFIAIFGLIAAFGIALLVLRYRARHN